MNALEKHRNGIPRSVLVGVVILLLYASPTFAERGGTIEVDGKVFSFRFPTGFCVINPDNSSMEKLFWNEVVLQQNERGELKAMAVDCETLEQIERSGAQGILYPSTFRLASLVTIDRELEGTRADMIAGLEWAFTQESFLGDDATFLAANDYGAFGQVGASQSAEDTVVVFGLTVVNGVYVSVEFLAYNRGSLTRNGLLADTKEMIRKLVIDNGV
ncbi:MAG: hypothetical protein HN768_07405, partial [Rhodospirillaceae bacterium]|nr:hypothetical protein [Rhodospirillaceae bacterium]